MINNKLLLLLLMSIVVSCQSSFRASRFQNIVNQKLMIDRVPIHYNDTIVKLKKISRCKGYDVSMPMDEFMHVYALTKMERISQIISQKTGFTRANSSSSIVLHWLSAALLSSHTQPHAYKMWRSLGDKVQNETDGTWNESQKVFEISNDDISDLHKRTQDFQNSADDSVISDIVERAYGDGSYTHSFCDQNQITQEVHPLRNLETMKQTGLMVSLLPEFLKKIKAVTKRPLVEALKNNRYVAVSGLRNSKVSLIVHDYFDHLWTYSLLKSNGIFDRYKSFLQSVGNPHATDIFSREGELIASIAYNFRYTNLLQFKPVSFLSYDQLSNLLISAKESTDNQRKALSILQNHQDNKHYTDYLPTVVSSVYTEMMQQHIKNGVIKKLNNTNEPVDILSVVDPEYLALIIETYHHLYANKEQGFRELKNVQLIMEEYLSGMVNDTTPNLSIIINNDKVKNFDVSRSSLHPNTISWFGRNLNAVSDKTMFN